MPVFATVSNDYAAASKAVNIGRPLCIDTPDSRAARDLATLARKLEPADQVEAKLETVPARPPGHLRLFGKRKAS
jgi:Flp pilus assembly CpaE family ATPase